MKIKNISVKPMVVPPRDQRGLSPSRPTPTPATMLPGRPVAAPSNILRGLDSIKTTAQGIRGTTTTTGGTPFGIRDLPTPTISQTDQNQMFVEGIRGKTMGDLTPEEITRLISIERGKAEQQGVQDLTGFYDPQVGYLRGQVSEAERALQEGKALEEADRQKKINETFGLVDTKYAPELRRLEEAGSRQVEDTQRSFSFGGASRGSRADEARQVVIEKNNDIRAAKDAEIRLEKQLLQAQIEGASDLVIQGLSDSLGKAKTALSALQGEQATALANLKATLATTGQSSVQSFLQTLQTQAGLAQFDPNLSGATGSIVDSQGRPIKGADGKPLTMATMPAEASAEISKQLGYLADKNGGAILDTEGKPIPINKPVKGTFQDGSKNTYILFEDGSVQQIGSNGRSAGGGSGLGGGRAGVNNLGFNPALASLYDSYVALSGSNDPGLKDFTAALNDFGIDSTDFIEQAAAYNQYVVDSANAEQAAAQGQALVSDYGKSRSSQDSGSGLSGLFGTSGSGNLVNPNGIGGFFNNLFGK